MVFRECYDMVQPDRTRLAVVMFGLLQKGFVDQCADLRQGAHFTAEIAGNGPRINGSLQLCLI